MRLDSQVLFKAMEGAARACAGACICTRWGPVLLLKHRDERAPMQLLLPLTAKKWGAALRLQP